MGTLFIKMLVNLAKGCDGDGFDAKGCDGDGFDAKGCDFLQPLQPYGT